MLYWRRCGGVVAVRSRDRSMRMANAYGRMGRCEAVARHADARQGEAGMPMRGRQPHKGRVM